MNPMGLAVLSWTLSILASLLVIYITCMRLRRFRRRR